MDKKPLILDVETKPLLAYIWQLGEQRVNLSQLKEDWDIMAWSAKWLGDPVSKVIYHDRRNDKDDKRIMKPLWDLLNEAEIVITQNGQSFDGPRINARFILNGMRPPKPYKHLDTFRIAKKVADFTSHSLEYLTEKLNVKYQKLSHGKYPGLTLWKECLKGNKEAWEEMKKYNIHDVLSTEELFVNLRAWAPETMVKVFNDSSVCRMCGGNTQKRGLTQNKKKQRVVCVNPVCGAWDSMPLPKEVK